MCEYQRGTIECRGDGFLWDADHDGYDPEDLSMPCPNCNTAAFLTNAKEFAESTSDWSNMSGSGTGVDIWQGSVAHARHWNQEAAEAALRGIGKVEALKPHPTDPGDALTEVFTYA